MKKVLYAIIIIVMISGCNIIEYRAIADNMFSVEGVVYDVDNEPIESVNVKIVSIDASEDHESFSQLGAEVYSDNNGVFLVGVICNTTWTYNKITRDKDYINYIESITLEFSKDGYNTLTKEFITTDFENIYFNEDITLLE